MPTPHAVDKQPPKERRDVGREIDAATPSPELKRAVARDLDAHLPADMIEGQATEEPLRRSQRDVQENESPGS